MSASPSDMPSQLEAPHPEFGYFAPTRRLRRKIGLTLKATVLGGLAGAAVVFFMTVDREERPVTMLARPVLIAPASSTPAVPTPAPVTTTPAAPVRFIPQTMALPAAAPHDLGLRGSGQGGAATASRPPQAPTTVGASPAASADTEALPAVAKAAAKPKKKTARTPHEPEPEPRAAHARPLRPFGLPIFGFGW